MLRSIIRPLALIILFAGPWIQAQDADSLATPAGRASELYGIRLGADLSRLLITALDDKYTGFEIVGDYRLTDKWYLAAELGNESRRLEEVLGNEEGGSEQLIYDLTSSGNYLKVGADFNTYRNWFGMNNQIVVGARYGFSTFSMDLDAYNYFNSNRYWDPDGFVPGPNAPAEFSGLNASWLEVLLGVKVELIARIYLGASVRLGMLVSRKESDVMPHIWVPGFNRVTEGSSFGVGFNYSLSYFIPFYRKARVPESVED